MEQKLNITEILKNKALGTKLWSSLFGDVYFNSASANLVMVSHHKALAKFWCNAKLYDYDEAEPTLFPSKEMRNWSKFAWKKGDLLINSCGFQCIFKEWSSDDYTKFNGCYSNSRDGYEDVSNAETANFVKLDNNTTYEYVKEIERKLGGKLNLKTLEIEKIQPEFKDGDIVIYGKSVAICRKFYKHTLCFYVSLNDMFGLLFNDEVESSEEYRFATEEEKQQLFSALEKEGKAWDSDKKAIVDLKPKVKLKPFDKVIVRCSKADKWSIDFFSYKVSNGYICTGDARFGYCLPYNEETAHLLGTIDEWKGDDHD